ncbi:acetoin utilization protein AcuC [Gordonia liuliyuniae]|uniref:Acetoin utilization protein AcuC n=1 Tax=Gordonia liuliyuniae TaxID=2911517 RepID=A0ABS9IRC5_9ACTN|nr:acetoin utilization protein AcuC [Gordonia liuliyuniae]MCF8588106.1 acetoin utilization protein AcuC [Gordonia liuliyuniae]
MSAAIIWSDHFLDYKWAYTHPMSPIRLALTMSLSRSLGVLDEIETTEPLPVDDSVLTSVHTQAYVDAVRAVGSGAAASNSTLFQKVFGLGSDDNPVFASMHEAGSMLVGGTLAAAQAISSGAVRRAVNIGGGMHHAMAGHAAGFCIYNDCSIAIEWLLEQGYDRIAYVDIDAHHGDGVQKQFYGDPRVMTVSVHQHPATLWPGTGWSTEVGESGAEGSSVNLGLLPGITDRMWLRGFHAVVPAMIAAFKPQILVTQIGVDSHAADPLTDLALTVDGQAAAVRVLRDLADKYCEGRWLAVGGGGYGIVNVVPRAWTHLIGAALDRDVDPATTISEEWIAAANAAQADLHPDYARPPEATMGDEGDIDYVPWDGDTGSPPPEGVSEVAQRQTDKAILATRRAVFPLHGLDPEDPRD